MAFRNIFKPLPPKSPARLVSNVTDANFIRNFINDLQGVGCRVEIPKHLGGLGAKIIVGSGSDEETPENWPEGGGGNATFEAYIDNNLSTWRFKEQEQTGAGTWTDKAGGRTGTAYERNGIAAPGTGSYSFRTLVYAQAGGTIRYSFNMPIMGSGVNREVLNTDANGVPDWGCVRGA